MTHKKIIFLGASGTGKTCLCKCLVGQPYRSDEDVTIGVDFFETHIDSVDGNTTHLQCWDTAGQEQYRSLVSLYYKNISVVCLVFDLSNPSSLQDLEQWVQELSTFYPEITSPEDSECAEIHHPANTSFQDYESSHACTRTPIQLILIGNKADLKRNVNMNEVRAFADKYRLAYFECSLVQGTATCPNRNCIQPILDSILKGPPVPSYTLNPSIRLRPRRHTFVSQFQIFNRPLPSSSKRCCQIL